MLRIWAWPPCRSWRSVVQWRESHGYQWGVLHPKDPGAKIVSGAAKEDTRGATKASLNNAIRHLRGLSICHKKNENRGLGVPSFAIYHHSPQKIVWFLFLDLHPPGSSASASSTLHTILSHTTCHIQLCHTQLCHTQLCHTQLCHTQLCHTQLCHAQIVTHTHTTWSHTNCHIQIDTYNFVTHTQLCHTCHTQLCHTQLCHTQLCHTQLCHTQLCHAQIVTHNFVTYKLSHTTLSHTTLSHTTWRHLPSFHVAGVALGDIQAWYLWDWAGSGDALGPAVARRHFAWQAWHLATSAVVSRGRRGTW